ncbi:MAG: NADH-quinone oxidoreductase subunit H [Puniceicoccales bacterium]|jgi:NADH-quinone oxidoreductase subunit H|nr:NADH-quinone oxidoreductase subunit H [Puniceicoccales bacterium]
MDWSQIVLLSLYAIAMVLVVMSLAGYSVLLERKVAAWIQGRPGPNRTTIPLLAVLPVAGRFVQRLGLVQLPADGAKFLFKEDPFPAHVNKLGYFFAPCLALAPALVAMVMLPFGQYVGGDGVVRPLVLCHVDPGFLFMFAVSSLGVYGIILAGWSSNSKYPFLGAIRGAAQLISYELTMGLAVLPVVLATARPGVESPLNLFAIAREQGGGWNLFTQPLGALLFLVAVFAEVNRQPFDMPESETDLVGGFHTEYGSFKFGLFFVGEYGHMIIGSGLFILFFLGGWSLPFVPQDLFAAGWSTSLLGVVIFLAKLFCMVFFFVWVRWTVPRFRYDQVMRLGWSCLLPLALANLFIYLAFYALHG